MLLDCRAFVEQQLQALRKALPETGLDASMRQRAEIVGREVAMHLKRTGLPSRRERTPVQLWASLSRHIQQEPSLADDPAIVVLRRLGEFYLEQPEGFAWDWAVQIHDDGVQDGEIDEGVLVEEWVACWRTAHCSITQLSVHSELDNDPEAGDEALELGFGQLIDALFDGHSTVMLDLSLLSGVDDEACLDTITRRQVLRSHRDHALGLIAIDMCKPAAAELLSYLAGHEEGALVCMLNPSVNWEAWAAWLDELLQSLQVRERLKIRELCDSRCWQRLFGSSKRDVVLLDDLWDYVPWVGVINGDHIDGSVLLYSKDRGRLLDFLEEETVPVE